MVCLDNLQKYEPHNDPRELLSETGQVIYPVMVNNNVRSSVMLAKIKEEWKAVSYGNTNLSKLYEKTRAESSKSTSLDSSSYFIVQIPALNLFFVGYNKEEILMLIPILDDQGFDFKIGEASPAKEVFERTLEAARKHDGLPR